MQAAILAAVLWTGAFLTCVPGVVTHYGESYQGQQMGCPGSNKYDTLDETIVAIPYHSEFSCYDQVLVAGPAGILLVTVQDTCPGCGQGHFDLSEAGIEKVCGPGLGVCKIQYVPYPLNQ